MTSDKELDLLAQKYADKLWPCEPPCDSYGVCENCIERSIFHSGYNFGARAGMRLQTERSIQIAEDHQFPDWVGSKDCCKSGKHQTAQSIAAAIRAAAQGDGK